VTTPAAAIVEAAGTAGAFTTTAYTPLHLPAGLPRRDDHDLHLRFFGNLRTKTITDTTTSTAPYSTNGVSRTWTWRLVEWPARPVKKPAPTSTRRPVRVCNSGAPQHQRPGPVTRITQHLPAVGRPWWTRRHDPANRRRASGCDSVGTATTTHSYDKPAIRSASSDGSIITNIYDAAHRLTGVTDLFGQSMTYTLGALAAGHKPARRRQRPAGAQPLFGPDALGRPRAAVGASADNRLHHDPTVTR
jgi:hypothetical protein